MHAGHHQPRFRKPCPRGNRLRHRTPRRGPLRRPPNHRGTAADRSAKHGTTITPPVTSHSQRQNVASCNPTSGRSGRVPHWHDHRRARPVHRCGHHLDRPGVRRRRGSRRAGHSELDLPGPHGRRARMVLPLSPARLAGPRADRHVHFAVPDRQISAHRHAHPAAGRRPDATTRRTPEGSPLVRDNVAETRWPQRSSSAACARACGTCPG